MEYNGWNLYDEVTIVMKPISKYRKTNYPQAYIVNPKDSKQLKTAINWATERKYEYNKEGKIRLNGERNPIYTEVEPVIVTTKNKDFSLTLLDSADYSSQGGKQSFWNCLVTKLSENLSFVVGINADILLNTLIQNTFINGICKDTLSFARCCGGVGLINSNMIQYKEAQKDMQSRANMTKGKTTKWKLGHTYETLTKSDVYFGEIYMPILVKSRSVYKNVFSPRTTTIEFSKNTNNVMYSTIDIKYLEQHNIKNIKDMKQTIIKERKESIDDSLNALKSSKTTYADFILEDSCIFIGYSYYSELLKTKPSRKQGNFVLDLNNLTEEEYKQLLHEQLVKSKEDTLKLLLSSQNAYFSISNIKYIFADVYPRDMKNITDTEKELLKIALSERNIKYSSSGDAIEIYTRIGDKLEKGVNLEYLLS